AIRDCISWACFRRSPIAPMLAICFPPASGIANSACVLALSAIVAPHVAHRSAKNAQSFIHHRAAPRVGSRRIPGFTGLVRGFRDLADDLHVDFLAKKLL